MNSENPYLFLLPVCLSSKSNCLRGFMQKWLSLASIIFFQKWASGNVLAIGTGIQLRFTTLSPQSSLFLLAWTYRRDQNCFSVLWNTDLVQKSNFWLVQFSISLFCVQPLRGQKLYDYGDMMISFKVEHTRLILIFRKILCF